MEENGIEWTNKASFLHPTPKYPAGPKYPALSIPLNAQLGEILWLWDMGQHGTTIKWKTFSILPYNTQLPQKYPALATQQNTQLGVFLSTSLGFWDIGQHGTTIKWKTTQKNTQLPQKYLALSIQQNTQLGVFCRQALAFGHETAIK